MTAYQSKYLRAADLQGRSVSVVISNVTMEEFSNRLRKTKEKNAVIWFDGKIKGLVINKTRLRRLKEIFGAGNTECYINNRILLHPTNKTARTPFSSAAFRKAIRSNPWALWL